MFPAMGAGRLNRPRENEVYADNIDHQKNRPVREVFSAPKRRSDPYSGWAVLLAVNS